MINVSGKINALRDAQRECGGAHGEALVMKKNCTTCTRAHDSAVCFECQADATDDNLFPMWRGEEDAFHSAAEKFREMLDILPSTINYRLHEMLDELAKIYNAQKKPA